MLIATFISTAFNYVLVYIFVYQYRNLASILICIPFITSNIKKYGLSQWLSSKEYACNAVDTGDVGSIPGSGRYPLEEGMAIHSSIVARKIPWAEEPGRLQSMGS